MIDLTKKKHLFFDMDNTITRSRTPIDPAMRELLERIPSDIVIVSGQFAESIQKQTAGLTCAVMGQNGNCVYDESGAELWYSALSDEQSREILEHIEKLKARANLSVQDERDLVEHRGAQLCYSLIGHHEHIEKKEACDPDKTLRTRLLHEVPFDSESVEVKIGGTTTFDYFPKGKHKGFNVMRFIKHRGWSPDDSVYIGDGLFPGGNDEAVIGVIDTIPVEDHHHTKELLARAFMSN